MAISGILPQAIIPKFQDTNEEEEEYYEEENSAEEEEEMSPKNGGDFLRCTTIKEVNDLTFMMGNDLRLAYSNLRLLREGFWHRYKEAESVLHVLKEILSDTRELFHRSLSRHTKLEAVLHFELRQFEKMHIIYLSVGQTISNTQRLIKSQCRQLGHSSVCKEIIPVADKKEKKRRSFLNREEMSENSKEASI